MAAASALALQLFLVPFKTLLGDARAPLRDWVELVACLLVTLAAGVGRVAFKASVLDVGTLVAVLVV